MDTRFDHIIIGGGIAGVTAAETIKAASPSATVALFGDEPHALYSRVLLPRVVESKIPSASAYLRKEGQLEMAGISFFKGIRVEKVDTDASEIRTSDGRSFGYGTLLIATGGRVRRLECPGGDDKDILHFQTMEDAETIRSSTGETSAVVGAGFIALELLMGSVRLGMKPTALLRKDRFFSSMLDDESARRIESELIANGVTMLKGVQVAKVSRSAPRFVITLDDGRTVETDHLGVGIGLVPNVTMLEGTGIAADDGVRTDATLRTSAPNVFAAGDVARFPDPCSGEVRSVGNWQNALFQGKHVAASMLGGTDPYLRTTAYTIAIFGLSLATIGAPDAKSDERIVQASDDRVLQIVLRGGRAIGATNVGKFPDRAAVTALIDSRRTLTSEEIAGLKEGKFPV